jgi:hypothetical protein
MPMNRKLDFKERLLPMLVLLGVCGLFFGTFRAMASDPQGISVKDAPYNAKGNGVADDGPAIIKALTATVDGGGFIFFPPGQYLSYETINIPATTSAIVFEGSGEGLADGKHGTLIDFECLPDAGTCGQGFACNGCVNITFENMTIENGTKSGPTFNITNSASFLRLNSLGIFSFNTSQSAISTTDGLGLGNAYIGHSYIAQAAGASVPAINLIGTATQDLVDFTMEDDEVVGSESNTAPLIYLEGHDYGGAGNIAMRSIRTEQSRGGALELRSVRNVIVDNFEAGDLYYTDGGAASPTAPAIKIDSTTAAHKVPSFNIEINGSFVEYGSATNQSLYVNGQTIAGTQGAYGVLVRSSYLPVVSNNGPGGAPILSIASNIGTIQGDPISGLTVYGGLVGITGVSSTNTIASNLRGSTCVYDGGYIGQVTFPVGEQDANYYVAITPTLVGAGTPAAGSNRVLGMPYKASGGFQFYTEAPVGIGNAQCFDWILMR